MAIKKNNDGVKVNLKEKTTVYATAKNPYHETGEEISCHPIMAEHLVMKDFATDKQSKSSKGGDAGSKD